MIFYFYKKADVPTPWRQSCHYVPSKDMYFVDTNIFSPATINKGMMEIAAKKTKYITEDDNAQVIQPLMPEPTQNNSPWMTSSALSSTFFTFDTNKVAISKYLKKTEQNMYIIFPNPEYGFSTNEEMGKNILFAQKESQIIEQVQKAMAKGYQNIHVYKLESMYKVPKMPKPIKYSVQNGEVLPE